MQHKASVVWTGGFKDGRGLITTESEALKEADYSVSSRFEEGVGTNPEELLAAAHAACFAMALSAELGKEKIVPKKLEVTATVTIDKVKNGFAITKSHLDLVAHIPNVDKSKFDKAAKAAKEGCPVSKLFRADIDLSTKIIS